jgi:dienelactone hydrolase
VKKYLILPALLLAGPAAGLTIAGCGEQRPAGTPAPRRDSPANAYLGDWSVLGPWPWDSGEAAPAATSPDLSPVLAPALDRPLFPGEPQVVSGQAPLPPTAGGAALRRLSENNGEMRLHRLYQKFTYQSALASTEIHSATGGDAALLIESDDGVKVWLNGQEVHRNDDVRRIQQFEDYAPVRLQPGVNRIVVKLVRAGKRGGPWDSWAFAVGVRTLPEARAERAARALIQEVRNSLLSGAQKLTVDLRLHEAGKQVELILQDADQRPVKRVTLPGGRRHEVDVQQLPDGLYHALVPQSARPQAFPVYKGDLSEARRRLQAATRALEADPGHQANLAAIHQRLDHLLRPEHQENQNHLWQAKIAALLAQWSTTARLLALGKAPFRDVAGTHLRGIRSSVDGANQYYLLHVPTSYRRDGGPIPLVIIQPYKVDTLRPFLQSIPVAEIAVLSTIARIADDTGMAFMWMDNRGNTFGNDFGETDMFTAIEQVARDYAIDRDRLYLFGSCSGGREALALAAKYPDRFAAVGTMSPTSGYRPYPPQSPSDAHGQLAYSQKTPLERMRNLLHVPVFALHGDRNEHSPLRESIQLRDAARAAGVDFTLSVVPGATHLRFPVDPREPIFRWFAGRRRVSNPDQVSFTSSANRYAGAYWIEVDRFVDAGSDVRVEARYRDGEVLVETSNVAAYRLDARMLRAKTRQLTVRSNGVVSFSGLLEGRAEIPVTVQAHTATKLANTSATKLANTSATKTAAVGGPVWDAFTGPMLAVIGGGGGKQRVRWAEEDAERFVESWRGRFLGDPLVKADHAVTAEDVRGRHLILFGDVGARGPLAALAGKLPFTADGQRLTGPGPARWKGPVGVQYAFPNPLNPQRYIQVNARWGEVPLPVDAVQLTSKAWYDYAVWRPGTGGQPVLADVGLFDPAWKRLISKLPAVSANEPGPAR